MTALQKTACMGLYLPAHRLVLRHDGYKPGWIIRDEATGAESPRLHDLTVQSLRARGWVTADGWLTVAGRAAVEQEPGVLNGP